MQYGAAFFNTYLKNTEDLTIVDIGSQDVNGSLRSVAPTNNKYIGVDFAEAKGVDVVITDPYSLPFEDESVDAVVSSSCFEHSEMFWLTFLEGLRILKPSGLMYINAPSNGVYHPYPGDSWRFFPDAGRSLSKWAQRNGFNTILLESYISYDHSDFWHDFVSVFLKDKIYQDLYNDRIINYHKFYYNARTSIGNIEGDLIKYNRSVGYIP
jgi:hypothetical protein